ncbi:MAG: indole-3-glycerol phosphate synthase TrpC, partial [Bacteroidaceae bacterium]|nr:indole-3-glycerol phosphate synthase TrpC [Bacteroidaceae bacterium]
MKDILHEIVDKKREELKVHRQVIPAEYLEEMAVGLKDQPTRSMSQALAASSTGIIAEFKRKSPSKGWIHEDAQPHIVIPAYEAAGATAISVLTDTPYFGGNIKYIRQVRESVHIPILRKDFIIDRHQLFEAKLTGADAVLLIAACLEPDECLSLMEEAHDLKLEVVLEIHSPEELSYIKGSPDMVGINNRNLGSFVTDVKNSYRLASMLQEATKDLPNQPVLISESGISNTEVIKQLREIGYRGFLIGETFMRAADPAE